MKTKISEKIAETYQEMFGKMREVLKEEVLINIKEIKNIKFPLSIEGLINEGSPVYFLNEGYIYAIRDVLNLLENNIPIPERYKDIDKYLYGRKKSDEEILSQSICRKCASLTSGFCGEHRDMRITDCIGISQVNPTPRSESSAITSPIINVR